MIFTMGIGFYFLGRQKTTKDYFIASRRIPGWAMGLGLVAALVSNITFLAFPGMAFAGDWTQFTNSFMALFVMFPIAFVIIPFYRNTISTSLYEYLEKRFGYGIRAYGAIAFILYYIARLGVIFFALALGISTMIGCNIYLLIILLGIVTIVYTWAGGIEGVTWTDVFQGILLILGGILCLVIALFGTHESAFEILKNACHQHKFGLGEVSFNLKRDTILVMVLYGLFQHAHNFGTDQCMIQRYLTAKTTRQAIVGGFISGIACVPVWGLFFFVGTALWGYYKFSGDTLPTEILQKSDRVFPHFIMTQLPTGVRGLILVALLSSAMSTLSAGLNSIATVFTGDIFNHFNPRATEKFKLMNGRISVFIAGSLSLALALWLVTRSENILVIYYSTLSIVGGGILGLFLLAFLTKRANIHGATIGIVACLLVVSWASLTQNGIINMGKLNYGLHPYLIGFFGHLTIFTIGYGASIIFPVKAAN